MIGRLLDVSDEALKAIHSLEVEHIAADGINGVRGVGDDAPLPQDLHDAIDLARLRVFGVDL